MAAPAKSGELHLALEGQEQHGIRITSSTSLSFVRANFPVPAAYIFGVPPRLEEKFKAADFLPLMLLRSEDCLQGKLGSTSAPANYKAERDRLEYEVAQLHETLKRTKEEHRERERELLASREQLERELAPLRARAKEADALEAEARVLRDQKSKLVDDAAELKAASLRESNRLIAQLADSSRECAQLKAAALKAAQDIGALRSQATAARGAEAELQVAARSQRRHLTARCAALAKVAAATVAAHAKVRSDATRLLADTARELSAARQHVARAIGAAESRAAGAATGVEAARAETAVARVETARLRAECDEARSELKKARAEGEEARAELRKSRAEKAQLSADHKQRASLASSDGQRLAAELAAAQAQLSERVKELKRARAEADAHRERERAQGLELGAAQLGLRQAAERETELEGALSKARAGAQEARQLQEEAEAAWAEAGGRRPVTFVEFVELRREVKQLAIAGREFFVTPDAPQRQGAFLTRVARVETMLTRDGPAAVRAAVATGGLPTAQSAGVLSRALSLASLPAAAAARTSLDTSEGKRRNSLGLVGGVGASSHFAQVQELRTKRQISGLKPPSGPGPGGGQVR